jgi:hypothetical protein
MAALEARYHVSPEGMTGEAYIAAIADRACDGDNERSARRILVRRRRCCSVSLLSCLLSA